MPINHIIIQHLRHRITYQILRIYSNLLCAGRGRPRKAYILHFLTKKPVIPLTCKAVHTGTMAMQPKLVIIEPDPKGLETLSAVCDECGWKAQGYAALEEFLEEAPGREPDCLIWSVPECHGTEDWDAAASSLKSWHEEHQKTQLVLLLPEGFFGGDRFSLRIGARHTLYKPFARSDIFGILAAAASGIGKRSRREALEKRLDTPHGFGEIIGTSREILEVIELAKKVAESDFTSVMILGEPGTGKGALAKAIHEASERRTGPFIEVNCGAIPRNLLESEFFGYEKGAFTDAKEEKVGLFECADGGTIFLDEVGEIDYGLQAKLLKFLDSRTIRRISGTKFLPVDVRIISATNADLKRAVDERLFRSDLFYRLNVVEITLPPLRRRTEDIRLIAQAYTHRFAKRMNKKNVVLTEEAITALEQYPWPGNVRELINIVERAVLLSANGQITPHDLPIDKEHRETIVNVVEEEGAIRVDLPPEGASLDEIERGVIIAALARTGGNVTQAAGLLGVGRGTLRYKMKKYGIDPAETKKNHKNGAFEPVGVND
jgi:two-component system response regulator AtoC